jgi:hypothetical protein
MAEEERDSTNIVKAIHELKDRDPFLPFEVVLTSGDKYVIERGANLVELKSEFFYAYPGGEDFVFLRKNQIAAVKGTERRR